MKNSYKFLLAGALLLVFTQACKQKPKGDSSSRLNVILFVVDDHGTDALGCYGNPIIKTPNLDNFANSGIRFTNAYCTAATCSASRASILTGKYGHATGHYGHAHAYHHFSTYDTIKALPVYLEEDGYFTARIGKYHLAPDDVYRFNEVLEADPRNTVEMAENCRNVIMGEKPFFLYFCTDDPHRGAPFQNEIWDMPNNFGNKKEGYPGVETVEYDPDSVIVPDFLPDSRECRMELAQYYQSVSRIDQGFGRLMEILKESEKDDNTLIIYISDNGIAFPGAKTTTYDPGIKLPCIVSAPGLRRAGEVNDAMISWVDLTPTILDYAGIDPEGLYFHGRSFKSIVDEETPEGWDVIYASHTFHEITMYYPMRVIRDRNYKLIWNIAWRMEYPFASDLWAASTWQGVYRRDEEFYGKRTVDSYLFRPEYELYDMVNDPDETNNLSANEAYLPVLDSLKLKLKEFQLTTFDPWIVSQDHEDLLGGSGVNL
jgi:N-sulfoglucosamine sulfohydrolase